MPAIPDLSWEADRRGEGPGVVLLTRLYLRHRWDAPAFLRTSMAIRKQVMASPGARCLHLRAQPLARVFTTVSWWDDDEALRTFVRTDPHRSAMRYWRPRLTAFSNHPLEGTAGVAPTMVGSLARIG